MASEGRWRVNSRGRASGRRGGRSGSRARARSWTLTAGECLHTPAAASRRARDCAGKKGRGKGRGYEISKHKAPAAARRRRESSPGLGKGKLIQARQWTAHKAMEMCRDSASPRPVVLQVAIPRDDGEARPCRNHRLLDTRTRDPAGDMHISEKGPGCIAHLWWEPYQIEPISRPTPARAKRTRRGSRQGGCFAAPGT